MENYTGDRAQKVQLTKPECPEWALVIEDWIIMDILQLILAE